MKTKNKQDIEDYKEYLKESNIHRWIFSICLITTTLMMGYFLYHYFWVLPKILEVCK